MRDTIYKSASDNTQSLGVFICLPEDGTIKEMTKHSFVIVSNRLPISVSKEDGKLTYESSSGGLATAMSSLREDDTVWVGWCGMPSDDLTSKEQQSIREHFAQHNAVPVFLTADHIANFYEGYANDTLWPLFHYFQSLSQHSDEYWQAYDEVNQLYGAAVKKAAAANARVWVHDYQLMLLPGLVREALPKATIGFFLHIPFPSFEIFRLLPERQRLLEGLMGSDVVGFHTYDYARHFLSTARRLLGVNPHESQIEYQGRTVQVGTYPIGIDYKKYQRSVKSAEVAKIMRSIKRRHKGQKIILSIDRLDYSKGIPMRLEAYRQLLEEHPEYREKVVLQMVAVPSRTGVEAYQQLRDQIELTVARINGLYGTADWAPISYQFQGRPFDEIVASYMAADVMLVTPIRDGMNLVAKEYVASKPAGRGVLVLSELAGAVDELTEALLVNPGSPRLITTALDEALRMPVAEQKRRMSAMQTRIKDYDVQTWAAAFIDDMKLVQAGETRQREAMMSREQQDEIIQRYNAAKNRLIILDYDGTLKAFQPTPSAIAGAPSLKMRLLLTTLAQKKSTRLAIVSGRPRKVLTWWFRAIKVDLAAEHGARVRIGGKWQTSENVIKKSKPTIRKIMEDYTATTPGSRVEEKEFSMVWHYRNVVPELAYNRSTKLRHELMKSIDSETLAVHMGHKIVEVKQRNLHKGVAVERLVETYQPDFVLCIGDDFTDEDMFQALGSQAATIKVGAGQTSARYRVPAVADVVRLLGVIGGGSLGAPRLVQPLKRAGLLGRRKKG